MPGHDTIHFLEWQVQTPEFDGTTDTGQGQSGDLDLEDVDEADDPSDPEYKNKHLAVNEPVETVDDLAFPVVSAAGNLDIGDLQDAWTTAAQADGPSAEAVKQEIHDLVTEHFPDSELADRDREWAGETEQEAAGGPPRTFRIEAPDDGDFQDDTLGWGAEFPNSGVYVDWNVDAWPDEDQLDGPHVSEYDTLEDAATVAEGEVVFDDDIDRESVAALQTAQQATPVAATSFTVRELDGIARQMDLLSRAVRKGGTYLWASADGEIAFQAELPEKYETNIGEEAFVPPAGVAEAAEQALEWREEHPDEFDAGADDGEGVRRARQLVRHHEGGEPLPPEYVVEVNGYLSRSEGQPGRAELDPDVPDSKPWLDSGYAAHQLWGGDAALEWTEDLIQRMEAVDEQVQQARGPTATATGGDDGVVQATLAGPATAVDGPTPAAPDGLDADAITKADSNEIDVDALPPEFQQALEAEEFILYGRANIEQYNRNPDRPLKIEAQALEDALDRYFQSEGAPGVISVNHDDIPIGVPKREHELEEPATIELEGPDGDRETYEFEAGDTLRTHVGDSDRDGQPEMWLVSNLANDTEMARHARLRALQGDLDGYSVTIHRNRDVETEDGGLVVKACDLHAVTLGGADTIMNPGSTFGVAEYQARIAG